MEHFSESKARSVARTDWNCNLSRLSCARRVLQHSSRAIALHLSSASHGKVSQMRCIKSSCKFRRPNKNPMDYYSYYLKHYYDWLYCIYICIYMPSDNEFVVCESIAKKGSEHHCEYYILRSMMQQNVQSSGSSVRVRGSSSSSSSRSSSSRSSIVVVLAVVVVLVVVVV